MNLLTDLWALIRAGGPVMVPIGLLSAWMWGLIALKADWIRRVRRRSLPLDRAFDCLASGAAPQRPLDCPKAAALAFFLALPAGARAQIGSESERLMWEVAVRRQIGGLSRHLWAIMALAAAAPLLGLLGTVSGMVETFRVIGLYGMGNAQAMASGIKEALITTQAGLLVAIPGVLAGQAMRRRVREIHNEVLVFHRAVSKWLEKEARRCSESVQ